MDDGGGPTQWPACDLVVAVACLESERPRWPNLARCLQPRCRTATCADTDDRPGTAGARVSLRPRRHPCVLREAAVRRLHGPFLTGDGDARFWRPSTVRLSPGFGPGWLPVSARAVCARCL